MKKIIILLFVLLLCACSSSYNTPTSLVQDYLSRYQNLDDKVLSDLKSVIERDKSMNSSEKEDYRILMEKQYQNLSYKINNEDIDNDKAYVDVEVEVLDYHSALVLLNDYDSINNIKDEHEYIDYKIEKMKSVVDKKKYSIIFNFEKDNNIWVMNDLLDDDIKKIHGLF